MRAGRSAAGGGAASRGGGCCLAACAEGRRLARRRLWHSECGAMAKSPFEAESRLRASPLQRPPLQSRTSPVHAPSRSHRRGHAHVEACPDLPASGVPPTGFGKSPRPTVRSSQSQGGMPDLAATQDPGLDRRGDGGRMRAREPGHARCGPSQRRLRSTSPVRSRLSASNGLFAVARHSLRPNVFVIAGGHALANPTAISRRGETTPRGAGIPGAHAPTSLFNRAPSPFPRK